MMCRRVLILLLATSVLTDDHLSEAEIVVERPGGSAVGTTSGGVQSIGGEEDSFRKSRQMDTELTQRQGPFGRPNMVSMTVNALNPMPYVMGGLKGVRDVVRQRFFPWRGMVLDNFARVFPRQRFRGGGPRPIGMPGPGFHGGPVRQSFGGGIEHGGGGGGGGGVHIGGGGSFKGSVGSSSSRFRDEVSPLTTDDPSGVHTPLRGSIEKGNLDFNTPKPKSIISASSISTESSGADNKPHRPNDIRNDVFSLSNLKTSTPSFSSSPTEDLSSGHDIVSPLVPTEKTKVISIEIPKEFDDLSVLEVSMKSNGDVSVGSKNVTNHAAFPEPFSRANPHFSATWNDHKFTSQSKVESRLTNPSNLHIGIPTNPDSYRGSITCLNALNNGQVKSIQDVLCMQNSGNNNKINGNSIRPEFSSIGNQHQSDIQNNGIDNSFQRQNSVPHFSANFGPDKQNINHIYFVPLSVPAPHHSIIPQVHGASMSNTQHVSSFSQSSRTIPKERDPNVFYIDITIPGTENAEPSIRSRSKRSLQFDGWYPMDVSNPMSDEPTLGYQPPPLERVHFSDDPVTDKPMYPVKPKNPTVFVVRAEPREPELHSVYGTENVEYFHIHPQTNTIRAFRAPDQSIGAIQFVSPPQFGESEGNSNHKKSETKSITEKEVGSGSEDGLFDDIRFIDTASQYASDYDLDMDGSFSEYSPVVVRPHDFHRRDPPGFRRYEFQETPARRRVDVIDLPPSRQRDTSRSSRPALYELLGNVKYESQIEETPYLGSATDSARTSVFREVPPPNFFQGQTSGRYSSQNVDKDIRRSGPRRPSYRNTGLDDSSSHPWYLIDTKSERRREPSIASYIHPETRLGDERVHYKPFGPVAYVSKDSERTRQRDSIYNPHLDDHMNSYKPSTSLIANSLSELLQIFKYTQVTDKPGKDSPGEDGITLVREFRYTRPTEETPTTVSSFEENLSSDNGYTSTPPSVKNDITRNVTANPEKVSYDAVADTNSLDGYLFSDSEASPEYAHPEVKPNIVIIEGKDIATSKGLIKDNIRPTSVIRPNATRENVRITSASSRTEKPTFGGLEIIYPGPEPKTTTSRSSLSSWPLYVIHEGHSKVKLFGINTTKDKNSLSKNIELLHLTEEPTTFATETEPPETTTPIPFTSTNLDITSTHILVDHNNTYLPTTTLEPTSTSPTFDTDNQDVPRENTNNNSEYEYYYYDEEELVPEAAFAGSYHSEGWEHPSLRLPGPPVSPVALNIPPPVPSQRSLAGDIVIPPSSAAFAHVFQERLPRPEGVASLSPDQIPLLPDVSLTRDQLSVGRPVFFTKRQQQQQPDVAEKDASISQPFEYLSHLRELGREKRSSTTHERDSVQLGEEGQRASEINSQA
ncbi:uncharacterized protein LOC135225242 [Macrobrachium nipponense]|uniref:uncharacterized protein LOC135225242 n=1 Tax=Macrobrachium nipponense TaxID=159736 RepID=UPI0030C7E270